MSDRILVPLLGESVTEATVAKWLKNEGDEVSVDEAIVELETDKVNIEVPAPASGTLDKISVKEGQTVNIGVLLGTISSSKSSKVDTPVEEKKYSPPPKELKVVKNINVPVKKKKRKNKRTFNSNGSSRRKKYKTNFKYKFSFSSSKKNCNRIKN